MNAPQQSIDGNTRIQNVFPIPATLPGEADQAHIGSQVLELTSQLQTSLEPEELVQIFSREVARSVPHDGFRFESVEASISMTIGRVARHRCAYQLVLQERRLGEIRFFRGRRFSDTETRTLENLLCALVYPLRNALLYRTALESSFVDGLTGAKNRAAMDAALEREAGLAHRQGTALSVILLDIDHFKQINDRFGHTAGDQVLQQVAAAIGETVRGSDLLFRYGGEEFLILLSHTTTIGAQRLAERVRSAIARLHPFPEEPKRKVTASLGVAELRRDDSGTTLIERADRALYRAKRDGRNRCVVGS